MPPSPGIGSRPLRVAAGADAQTGWRLSRRQSRRASDGADAPTRTSAQRRAHAVHPTKPLGSKLLVGVNIELKGVEISACDILVVEGHVEATVHSKLMQIAEPGTLKGTALIDVAEVHGEFTGELTARTRLVVHGTGRVSGTIRYGRLIVADGGRDQRRREAPGCGRLVRPELHAPHFPVVFRLGRHRDFGAVRGVDAAAAAPARIALVLARPHFRMLPAQRIGFPLVRDGGMPRRAPRLGHADIERAGRNDDGWSPAAAGRRPGQQRSPVKRSCRWQGRSRGSAAW